MNILEVLKNQIISLGTTNGNDIFELTLDKHFAIFLNREVAKSALEEGWATKHMEVDESSRIVKENGTEFYHQRIIFPKIGKIKIRIDKDYVGYKLSKV